MTSFQFVATEITDQRCIAQDTMQVRVRAPEFAKTARPGQFFMVRLAGRNDPLIGRALALFDVHADDAGELDEISLAYIVKGKFTSALSRCTVGEMLEVWGPLGNAFSESPCDHLILVAGGVGITPMLTLARAANGTGERALPSHYAKKVSLCYGARTASFLAGLDRFRESNVELHIATEDGSLGLRGRVTDSLQTLLEASSKGVRIACCGPEPMMHAVSELAARYEVPCEVSLETPMACGIGICFTCVAKIRQPDGSWDYRRTCVEGPIFPAESIVW